MSESEQKIVQYLNEAHAMELALTRVLQSQIAMTPRGRYRQLLETHLRETQDHSRRVQRRVRELRAGRSLFAIGIGLVESAVGQALALGKTPLDLLRGSGGEEKVLKNAKDTAATEALEIATYTAIARLASSVGDERTEQLAESILEDEQRMLARVLEEIPSLTGAVVGAEIEGDPSYELSETGTADVLRSAGRTTRRAARKAGSNAKRTTRQARRSSRRGDEPWPGYDEQNVEEIRAALDDADESLAAHVRAYERAHKDRAGVREASERQAARA